MRFPRLLARAVVLAAVAAPALPGIATTTTTTGVVVRTVASAHDVASGAAEAVGVSLRSTDRLVGVTWTSGQPRVAIRWKLRAGWAGWSPLESDPNTPNAAERAAARPGTEPAWRPDGALGAETRVAAGGRA